MTAPHLLIAGPSGQVQNYLSAFSALGSICRALPDALPKRLPIDPSEPLSAFLPDPAASFDALILPGGGDIDPALFHQENQGARAMDPELDRLQLFLLRFFLRKNLPVLGICKGMQLINVCLGGASFRICPPPDGMHTSEKIRSTPRIRKREAFSTPCMEKTSLSTAPIIRALRSQAKA